MKRREFITLARRHGGGVAVVGTRAAGGNAGDRNLGSGSSSAFAELLGPFRQGRSTLQLAHSNSRRKSPGQETNATLTRRSDDYNEKSCAAESKAKRSGSAVDEQMASSCASMRSEHFAAVVRVPQGLVQVRVAKHLPELIYGLPISPRMVGNHPLDR